MTLPRLIDEMKENFDFHATASMYKKHFRQWGLNKNLRFDRAVAALGHARPDSRNSQVVDRQLSRERLQNYIRRLPENRRQQALQLVHGSGVAASPPRSVEPPSDLGLVEHCIHLLSHHVRGSHESGEWPYDPETGVKYEKVVPNWCTSVMSAAWVLEEGKEREAQLLLARFQNEAPSQLQRPDPLIFLFFYTSVLYFVEKHSDKAWQLLRNFRTIADHLPWPGKHPLRLLFQALHQLRPDNILAYASTILLTYVDLIHKTLGGAYPAVQDMLSDAMMRLLRWRLVSPEQIADLGHNMCTRAEREDRHHNEYYFNVKLHISNAYLLMGKNRSAEQVLDEIAAPHNKDSRDPRILMSVDRFRAKLHESEGRTSDAIECVLRSLVLTMKLDGKQGPHLLNGLILLGQLYERAGQVDEARRVREDRDATLEALCNKDEQP
ncbi:Clr5 domain-containing protein [Apiospora phragmitis]|uniref:Clr5 domain-containing protein n=1 Tax=Apiospora phragmitis TaxID=2905665 RepID=A0ABR1X6A7_9PEZI